MVKIKELLESLQELYREGNSYDDIGIAYGISGGLAWKMINKGYEPRGHKQRLILGLPILGEVVSISGSKIPKGSQVLDTKVCPCSRPFIPNHWSRSKCFICSPYRPSKKRGIKNAEKD